jgi:hypothetical protein
VSVWDLAKRGTRGPKPRHDRAVIAATAVRIAGPASTRDGRLRAAITIENLGYPRDITRVDP